MFSKWDSFPLFLDMISQGNQRVLGQIQSMLLHSVTVFRYSLGKKDFSALRHSKDSLWRWCLTSKVLRIMQRLWNRKHAWPCEKRGRNLSIAWKAGHHCLLVLLFLFMLNKGSSWCQDAFQTRVTQCMLRLWLQRVRMGLDRGMSFLPKDNSLEQQQPLLQEQNKNNFK